MNKEDKGKKGESCNRSACQRPPALYYNQAMDAYYCRECAIEISKWDGDKENPLFADFEKNTEEHRQYLRDKGEEEDIVDILTRPPRAN